MASCALCVTPRNLWKKTIHENNEHAFSFVQGSHIANDTLAKKQREIVLGVAKDIQLALRAAVIHIKQIHTRSDVAWLQVANRLEQQGVTRLQRRIKQRAVAPEMVRIELHRHKRHVPVLFRLLHRVGKIEDASEHQEVFFHFPP